MKKFIVSSLLLLSSISQANCIVGLSDDSLNVLKSAQIQKMTQEILSKKGYILAKANESADLVLRIKVIMHACTNGMSALPCDAELLKENNWQDVEIVVRANIFNSSGEIQTSGVGSSDRFITGPSLRNATLEAVSKLEVCQ